MAVHDDPGAADRRKIIDGLLHLFLDDGLEADIDGELQRLGMGGKPCIEGAFDPGKAVIVEIGITDDMGGQGALRIDALFFGLKIEPRNAQFIDGINDIRRQMAMQPDEALAGFEPRR